MKRINRLTETQKARFSEWVEKWTKIGLSTEPADRARFEAAIEVAYKKASLTPPKKVVWVNSPLVLALAAPLAASIIGRFNAPLSNGDAVHNAVNDAVNDAVRLAVGDAVHSAVGDAVCVAVDGAVRRAVRRAVGDAVNDAVRVAVGDAVDGAVGVAVRRVVGVAVDGAVRRAVGVAVGDAVDGAVHSAVGDTVYSAVNDAVGNAVHSAVGVAVCVAVRDAVNDAVGVAVDGAVRLAVGDAVHVAVNDAVDGAVDGAVRRAVGVAVGNAVHSAVGDAVCVAVGVAVGNAVHSAVGDAVCVAVDGAVRRAVDGAVDGAVNDAVRRAVGVAVGDAVDGAVRDAVGDAKTTISANWQSYIGGQFWVGGWWWGSSAYISFFMEVCELELSEDIHSRAESYAAMCSSASWFWPHEDFVMVCERPAAIHRDVNGRLHNETGPAFLCRDGWGFYAWHGIRVTPEIIEKPITLQKINSETNQEIKRVMLEKYGFDRYIRDAGLKEIQSDQYGRLFNLPGAQFPIVLVKNSTAEPDGSFKEYVLVAARRDVTTAHAAVASTFGLTTGQYHPVHES